MSKLIWDKIGERYFETGVEKGVIYPYTNGAYAGGAAWSGLTSVAQNPSGAEATPLYADNIKYLNLLSTEEFGFTIGCYTYPPEFEPCIGIKTLANGVKVSQQNHEIFGFSYVTRKGNDTKGTDYGYTIHLVYGATAGVSDKENNTINDSPEAAELSYECTTTPVEVPGMKPAAHIEIDSTTATKAQLTALEEILYGKDGEGASATEARLPLPTELATIFADSDN